MPDNSVQNVCAMEFILASESPQRAAILKELGIGFHVWPMDVDEVMLESPEATVQENARRKLVAALVKAPSRSVIIAADTVLFAKGSILGKPKDRITAREYLMILSGTTVRAYSCVAVARKGDDHGYLAAEVAQVMIKQLSEPEIAWYVDTEEPLPRAGGFGISRYGEVFVESTVGAHSCVAGLPKRALLEALARAGVSTNGFFVPKELFLGTTIQRIDQVRL